MIADDRGTPNGPDLSERSPIEQAIAALSSALMAERERVDQLMTELADARAAERISADSAAALRHELDLLRARPWWRRWFR